MASSVILSSSEEKQQPTEDTARAAGRGGLAIAGAKVAFILLGFVQQVVLPAVIGSAAFGDYSSVVNLVSVVNNVVVATSIQGVSRAISSAPDAEADAVLRATLRIHALLGVLAALGFVGGAGALAWLLGGPHLAPWIRLTAPVILLYGSYAALVGSLNGRRRFGAQASLDVTYQVLRTVGLLGGAIAFARLGMSPITGALAGFVGAAILILPLAIGRAGLGKPGSSVEPFAYLRALGPLFVGQIFLNVLLQTDFFLLNAFLRRAGTAQGLAPEVAASFVGVQRGVQTFGLLPYQLLLSISFILFPMLARANASNSRDEVRELTRSGVRLTLIATGLMCAPIAGLAPQVLRFAYPRQPEIAEVGGAVLRVYALGMGAFAVLAITCSALVSLGRARAAALLTLAAIALVATGVSLAVPSAAFGADMLLRSAFATTTGLVLATAAAGFALARTAGGFVAPASLARVGAAVAAVVAIGSRLPWLGKLGVVPLAALLAVAYVVVLVATGELGKADLARVRRVAGKKA